ncbi:MAG: hypothetical protein U0531_21510 [Dehalococcoidia bacterium]
MPVTHPALRPILEADPRTRADVVVIAFRADTIAQLAKRLLLNDKSAVATYTTEGWWRLKSWFRP